MAVCLGLNVLFISIKTMSVGAGVLFSGLCIVSGLAFNACLRIEGIR